MSQPAVTPRKYLLVFGSLLLIVAATTLVGRFDLGPFNTPLAILFAVTKASLIAAFFMQAKFESKVIQIIIAGGVIWILIMISNTVGDYFTRGWVAFPGK
jgi:cytochrome c oxidase subunit IV